MIFRNLLKLLSITIVLLCSYTINSYSNIIILNGLTHEHNSQPGEKFKKTIHIQNTGSVEKDVRIYQSDYWYSYTGESRHDEAGTLPRSNASWINYNPQLVTLGANEKASIDFEVNVPDIDTLSGSYWSVIMVEGIAPPDTSTASRGVKINTAIRYAIQIITNVGIKGSKELQFLGLELGVMENEKVLHVAVANTGQQLLKPELSVEIFDESGNSLGVFTAERRKILPDTSVKTTLTLAGIKEGNYTAVLVADCDEDHVFGTNFTLEL